MQPELQKEILNNVVVEVISDTVKGIAKDGVSGGIKGATVGAAKGAAKGIVSTAVGTAIGVKTISIATLSSTAPATGIAGWLGFTTTTTTLIAVPVTTIIAFAGLLSYGLYKGYKYCKKESSSNSKISQ